MGRCVGSTGGEVEKALGLEGRVNEMRSEPRLYFQGHDAVIQHEKDSKQDLTLS